MSGILGCGSVRKALIACMRKLLVILNAMLHDKTRCGGWRVAGVKAASRRRRRADRLSLEDVEAQTCPRSHASTLDAKDSRLR